MLKDDGVNVEYVFPGGAVAYYDVDNEGNMRDYKSPYPLEQYKVVVDPEMILSAEEQPLSNGTKHTVLRLKWGRRVETIGDKDGHLKHLYTTGRTHVNHQKRIFIILPPDEGA
jgi:hypothetical protein